MIFFECCAPNEISCTVAEDGKSITFQPCGLTSHHPRDIEERYCVACHRWMGLLEVVRKIRKEMGL